MASSITPDDYVKKVTSRHAAYFIARVCERKLNFTEQIIEEGYSYIEDIDEDKVQRDRILTATPPKTHYLNGSITWNYFKEKEQGQPGITPDLPARFVDIYNSDKPFAWRIVDPSKSITSSINGATSFRIIAYPRIQAFESISDASDRYWAYTRFFNNLANQSFNLCDPDTGSNLQDVISEYMCGEFEVEKDLIRAIGDQVNTSDGTKIQPYLRTCFRAEYSNVTGSFLQYRTQVNNLKNSINGQLIRSQIDKGLTQPSTDLLVLADFSNKTFEERTEIDNKKFDFWNSEYNAGGLDSFDYLYNQLSNAAKTIWNETNSNPDTTNSTKLDTIISRIRTEIGTTQSLDLSNEIIPSKDIAKTYGGNERFNTSNPVGSIQEYDPETGELFGREKGYLDELESGTYKFDPAYEFTLQLNKQYENDPESFRQKLIQWWYFPVDENGEITEEGIAAINSNNIELPDELEFPENINELIGIETFAITTNTPRLIRIITSVHDQSKGRLQRLDSTVISNPNQAGLPYDNQSILLDNDGFFDPTLNEEQKTAAIYNGAADPTFIERTTSLIQRPVWERNYTHTQINIPPTYENIQRLDLMCYYPTYLCCFLTFIDAIKTHLDFTRLVDEIYRISNPVIISAATDENGNSEEYKTMIARVLEEEILARGQTAKMSILKNSEFRTPELQVDGKQATTQPGINADGSGGGLNQVVTNYTATPVIFDIQADVTTPSVYKMREDLINGCDPLSKELLEQYEGTFESNSDACNNGYPIDITKENIVLPSSPTVPPEPEPLPPIVQNDPPKPPVPDPVLPDPPIIQEPEKPKPITPTTNLDCLYETIQKILPTLSTIVNLPEYAYIEQPRMGNIINPGGVANPNALDYIGPPVGLITQEFINTHIRFTKKDDGTILFQPLGLAWFEGDVNDLGLRGVDYTSEYFHNNRKIIKIIVVLLKLLKDDGFENITTDIRAFASSGENLYYPNITDLNGISQARANTFKNILAEYSQFIGLTANVDSYNWSYDYKHLLYSTSDGGSYNIHPNDTWVWEKSIGGSYEEPSAPSRLLSTLLAENTPDESHRVRIPAMSGIYRNIQTGQLRKVLLIFEAKIPSSIDIVIFPTEDLKDKKFEINGTEYSFYDYFYKLRYPDTIKTNIPLDQVPNNIIQEAEQIAVQYDWSTPRIKSLLNEQFERRHQYQIDYILDSNNNWVRDGNKNLKIQNYLTRRPEATFTGVVGNGPCDPKSSITQTTTPDINSLPVNQTS